MARVNTNEQWELIVNSSVAEQIGITVWHFQCMSMVGLGCTDVELATSFSTLVRTAYKALLNLGATFNGVSAQRIFPLPRTVRGVDLTGAGVGSGTGDLLPRQVAGILTLTTDLAGRKYRGRKYIPFPGEADNDPTGVPSAVYKGKLDTLLLLCDDVLIPGGGGNTSNLAPVIYHKATFNGTQITGGRTGTKWATQRRRGSFGRPNF